MVPFHARLPTPKLSLSILMESITIQLADSRKITKSVLSAGVKRTESNIGAFVILGAAIGVKMVSSKLSVV